MKKEKQKRPSLPPHWYYIYQSECVLCGAWDEERERRFTKRPELWEERHEYEQYACASHFM
jgi:hypothetical protein